MLGVFRVSQSDINTMSLMDVNFDLWVENEYGDRYLRDVNPWTFENMPAQEVYLDYYGDMFQREETLYVLIGADSGLLLNYIQRNALPKSSTFIFVEADELVDTISEQVNDENKDWVKVCSLGQWQETLIASNISSYCFLRNISLSSSMATINGTIPCYQDILLHVDQNLQQYQYDADTQINNEHFFHTQFNNLPDFITPTSVFEDRFRGKTACVLGAGPSVDDFIPWLLENRDKVVLFCVSRICERLYQVGLKPDFIVTVDPQDISFYVSRGVFHFENDAVLIFQYHSSQKLVGQWLGQKVYLSTRFPYNTPLNVRNFPSPGPTVSHTAISAAIQMGFDEVLLSGVDLCFSDDGNTHAKGNVERDFSPSFNQSLIAVEANDGSQAMTNVAYHSGIDMLSHLGKLAQVKGVRLTNVSSKAVKVESISYTQISDLQITESNINKNDIISNCLPEITDDMQLAYLDEAKKQLETSVQQIQKLTVQANKAQVLVNRFFDNSEKHANSSVRKKIDRIEKSLMTSYGGLGKFVSVLGLRRMINVTRFEKESDESKETTKRYLINYYQNFKYSLDKLNDLLQEASGNLLMRRAEIDGSESFQRLTEYWQEASLPRRKIAYLKRFPLQDNAGNQSAIDELESSEKELWSYDLSKNRSRRDYLVRDVLGLTAKLRVAFVKKDMATLSMLSKMIKRMEWEQKEVHLKLCEAYIAELEGEVENALLIYQTVIEDPYPGIVNDALLRIAMISIRQGSAENAVMALQCLAQLSYRYAVPYAEILALVGEINEAESLFDQYLAQYPKDKFALNRYLVLLNRHGNQSKAAKITESISQSTKTETVEKINYKIV